MAQRKHLPPLKAGKEYMGWVGFSDGEPHAWVAGDGYDNVMAVQVFFSRRSAHKRYEDVRRVRILVEEA